MTDTIPGTPCFRVDKSGKRPRVFIQCSLCKDDVREMQPHEEISVRRGYLCDKCSGDGKLIPLNARIPKND